MILTGSIYLFNFSFAELASSKKEGKKIYVPKDYKTIKEALENSEEGDKIYLAAGKYEEPSGLRLKSGIEIYGAGADVTNVTLGGIGMMIGGDNVIKDIGFKLATGGMYVNSMDNVTLWSCVISGTGGVNDGLSIEKGEKIEAINCTITNFASGISIRYSPCDILIKNCVISNNRIFGIAVSREEEDKNSYFDDLKGVPTEPLKKSGGEIKVTLEYNDIWSSKSRNYYGIDAGEHDISKDPKFVSESDYRLQPGSPCIDAGDPDSKYNDSDGSRNDLGAFPYGVQKK